MDEDKKPAFENFNLKNFTKTIVFALVLIFLIIMCRYYPCGFYGNIENYLVMYAPKLTIIIFMFVLIKFVTSSIKILIEKKDGEDKFKIKTVLSFTRYFLWIVFLFIIFTMVFEDLGALLTSVGLIGFGITFALQKPILNTVGWITIKLHKTFEVGDRIKVGQITGDVEEIKIMHTVVKRLLEEIDQSSGKLVSIPNELTLVEPVENYTKDDNFVKTELKIAITYESDWRKAKNVFESIVEEVTKKNLHKFKKNLTKKISFIDNTIEKLSERIKKAKTKERGEKLKEHIDKLKKEKEDIKETFEDMPSWFRPQIHVDMEDSSILLLALFAVPYDMIRNVKTEINSMFLDAVSKDEDFEVAYPHMQIVGEKKKQKPNRSVSEFLGIDNINLKLEK